MGTDDVFIHKHARTQDVVIVPRETIQRIDLSFAARGLLSYMLSLPQNWKLNEVHLIKQSPLGRDGVRSLIRELEAFGYLHRTTLRAERGRLARTVWHVFETPSTEIPSTVGSPWTASPATAKPSMVKIQLEPVISPRTEIPSTVAPRTASPLTALPATAKPSTYKENISTKRTKNNPQSASHSSPPYPLEPAIEPEPAAPAPAALASAPTAKRPRTSRYAPVPAADADADLAGLDPETQRNALAWWNESRLQRHGSGAAWTRNAWAGSVKRLQQIAAAAPDMAAELAEKAAETGWQALELAYLGDDALEAARLLPLQGRHKGLTTPSHANNPAGAPTARLARAGGHARSRSGAAPRRGQGGEIDGALALLDRLEGLDQAQPEVRVYDESDPIWK